MNTQLRFNFKEGQNRKERGIARASSHPLLEHARTIALRLLETKESVCSDDVQAELMREGYGETELGNAMGAVFKDKRFKCVGYTTSQRVRANGNLIRLWQKA